MIQAICLSRWCADVSRPSAWSSRARAWYSWTGSGFPPDPEDAQPCASMGACSWKGWSCIGPSLQHHYDVRAPRAPAPAARARVGRHALLGAGAPPQGSREAGHRLAVCLWWSPRDGASCSTPAWRAVLAVLPVLGVPAHLASVRTSTASLRRMGDVLHLECKFDATWTGGVWSCRPPALARGRRVVARRACAFILRVLLSE